jgi:hypothetical protein
MTKRGELGLADPIMVTIEGVRVGVGHLVDNSEVPVGNVLACKSGGEALATLS